uniref:Uncharacterized protein n=1 Tax=Romanomermis culicivorax TaxID=13658 RepID=A0A915HLA8_ROMCU
MVETATPVWFVLMATMILATPMATIMTDTDKTSITAMIINETTDLPPTLAKDAAIEKKLLYTSTPNLVDGKGHDISTLIRDTLEKENKKNNAILFGLRPDLDKTDLIKAKNLVNKYAPDDDSL